MEEFKKPWLILLIHYGILITLTRNVKQTEMTFSSHLAIMGKKGWEVLGRWRDGGSKARQLP